MNYPRDPNMSIGSIQEVLNNTYPQASFDDLDGISMFLTDWKVNLRFSNTEPLLRMSLETIGKNTIETHKKDLQTLLQLPDIEASSH